MATGASKSELQESEWLKGRLPNQDDRYDFMEWLQKGHDPRVGEEHVHLKPGSKHAERMLKKWKSEERGVEEDKPGKQGKSEVRDKRRAKQARQDMERSDTREQHQVALPPSVPTAPSKVVGSAVPQPSFWETVKTAVKIWVALEPTFWIIPPSKAPTGDPIVKDVPQIPVLPLPGPVVVPPIPVTPPVPVTDILIPEFLFMF